jgi:hypothetical protein
VTATRLETSDAVFVRGYPHAETSKTPARKFPRFAQTQFDGPSCRTSRQRAYSVSEQVQRRPLFRRRSCERCFVFSSTRGGPSSSPFVVPRGVFTPRDTAKRTGERHVESTSATRVFSFQRREPTSCVATDSFSTPDCSGVPLASMNRPFAADDPLPGECVRWVGFAVSLFDSRTTMHSDRLTTRHQLNLEEVFKHGLQKSLSHEFGRELHSPMHPLSARFTSLQIVFIRRGTLPKFSSEGLPGAVRSVRPWAHSRRC